MLVLMERRLGTGRRRSPRPASDHRVRLGTHPGPAHQVRRRRLLRHHRRRPVPARSAVEREGHARRVGSRCFSSYGAGSRGGRRVGFPACLPGWRGPSGCSCVVRGVCWCGPPNCPQN